MAIIICNSNKKEHKEQRANCTRSNRDWCCRHCEGRSQCEYECYYSSQNIDCADNSEENTIWI